MAEKTTRIFVIVDNNWLASSTLRFDIHENVVEGPKTFKTSELPVRLFKKDDPNVFTDGKTAAREYIRLSAEKRAKLMKIIERLDEDTAEVKTALEEAENRKAPQ